MFVNKCVYAITQWEYHSTGNYSEIVLVCGTKEGADNWVKKWNAKKNDCIEYTITEVEFEE